MADSHPNPVDHPTHRLVGDAPAMAALRAQIRQLAPFDTLGSPAVPTLLLQGETGTGKGLVARVIHDSGPRTVGPFIEVNCAAIPESMLEAELFGFEAGAFTDAKRAKPGLFEAAVGGTLLLDEVDALPLTLQGKLLTAIETKRVRRLGAVAERAVDVKLIAATNAVLEERITTGHFRADLYHRLAVLVLGLPPLRARGADVLLLAGRLLQQYTTAHGVPPKRLSAEAQAWLEDYTWPGNVRELIHVMERVTLLHIGEEVDAGTLAQLGHPLTASVAKAALEPQKQDPVSSLPAEAEQIRQALTQTGGNVVRAARLLGLSRDTMRYRMQRYGIARANPSTSPPPVFPLARSTEVRASRLPQQDWSPPPKVPITSSGSQEETNAEGPPEPQADARDAGTDKNLRDTIPAWEQKPIAVLALEVTWPEVSEPEPSHYDPWTVAARWEQALVDKVHGFGGALVECTASLLIWAFGLPQALEQLPQRAVHSALAIRQMAVAPTAADMPPYPEMRLAVHLGAVRVDNQAPDPMAHLLAVGGTLALPVRLLGQAAAGEILVSPEVGRLVDGWVALEKRPLQLGATESARVGGYAVVGVNPGREAWAGRLRPSRSPFVGRQRELLLLEALLEQVKAGRGQVVSLVGAPGMGKSRLLDAFRQRLAGQSISYVAGQCLAYGSMTPYLPVLDLLRDYGGIAAEDSLEKQTSQLRASLQQARLDPDPSLPLLLDLLGLPVAADELGHLSPEARKARTFETIRQVFLASGPHHPLVLAVEDLHWIDPTSEALLASLVDSLAGAAILLLATVRPGYHPRWLDKSYATQIALHPLEPDESRQVVRHVVRDTTLTPVLEQQLLARAEGNPFFLEELAHTVRGHREGAPALAVPDTIQAVLAARVDRLPPAERQLLQAASVLGKDIAVPLLQAIAERPEATLQQELAHLQAAEFLYETRLFPEQAYTFKHALTHEVAYASLPHERRRALHARIVAALEARTGDGMVEPVDHLAHHALQGEMWDKAVAYGRQTGEKALARSAYREAVASFEQALGALPHLPQTRDTREQAIDLQLALRSALRPLGNFERILAALHEAESLAEALDDHVRLAQVSRFLSNYFYLMAAYDQAIAAAQRALALAAAEGAVVLRALANQYLGVAYQVQGDYCRAIDCFRQTLAFLEGARRHERFGEAFLPAVFSRACLALCHSELGTFAEGGVLGAEGLRIAEAVDHPASLMWAYWGFGRLSLRQGNMHRALPRLERAVSICQDADLPAWFPRMAVALGEAYTLVGRTADAVALLTQAMEQSVATERAHYETLCRLSLGEALVLAGHLEESHALAEHALALAKEHQERGYQAYALRLLGDIAARRETPQAEQAEARYQQALALADELDMRPLMAHCHRGLGTLYSQTGQQAQARTELLAAIALYRTMDMTFWLPETEAALAEVHGDDE